MIDHNKLNMLIGLLERGRITLEDIKDTEYRAEVEALLGQAT